MKVETLNADGSVDIKINNSGKPTSVFISGDFGGGTITPYISPDQSEFFQLQKNDADFTVTEKSYFVLQLPAGELRFVLAGSTDPSITIRVM